MADRGSHYTPARTNDRTGFRIARKSGGQLIWTPPNSGMTSPYCRELCAGGTPNEM